VVLALGLIAALAIATPVFGLDSSIKKAIKKEVAKQVAKATGPAGPPGASGAPGAPGTARAYARVIQSAGDDCTGGCTFDRASGVTSVTRLDVGSYCVIAPGLSPTTTTAAVTVDSGSTSSPGNASAMISAGFSCGGGGFLIQTQRQTATTVCTNDTCAATASVAGNAAVADDVSFTILIA
jgi:hypothetical protein